MTESIYHRVLKLHGLIPPDLIQGFQNREPKAIEEVREWIAKNGQTILSVKGVMEAGDEIVVTDKGYIFLSPKEPRGIIPTRRVAKWLGLGQGKINKEKVCLIVKYGEPPLG
jgi:hypothetical protein